MKKKYKRKVKNYKSKKRVKTKNNKIIYLFISFIGIIIMVFSSYKILLWQNENKEVEDTMDEILEEPLKNTQEDNNIHEEIIVNPPEDKTDDYWDYINMDFMNIDFAKLKERNADTVGFIKVNGTNINYPVVQTKDNDFYLNHAFDKKYNSAGWIFADYRNDMKNFGKNTIIYGHGRLNNIMFGSLKNILKSDWFDNKNNYIIKFLAEKENTLWQVFSVYSIKVESYYITTNFASDNEYNNFLQTLKKRSIKHFSAEVNSNDKIITLSTCQNGGRRVVMHAKLIKKETK